MEDKLEMITGTQWKDNSCHNKENKLIRGIRKNWAKKQLQWSKENKIDEQKLSKQKRQTTTKIKQEVT